jgi:ABC-type transport system substrate-binding protein
VGVKVNLLQMDNATETAQRNALKFKNLVRLQSIGGNILDSLIIWNLAGTGVSNYGYLTPELFAMRDELNRTMDQEKQVPMLKRIGEWGFTNYWDIPLWYVPLEVMVNPQIVDNWTYPGTSNGGWSHFETISAAR